MLGHHTKRFSPRNAVEMSEKCQKSDRDSFIPLAQGSIRKGIVRTKAWGLVRVWRPDFSTTPLCCTRAKCKAEKWPAATA
jgi:hypothetical protein